MRKILLILALAMVFCCATELAGAPKKKPFYDSKSQLLGISGSYDSLCARGYTQKIFNNPIEMNVELPTPEKKKKGFTDAQVAEIQKQLERQGVAKKVLDYLFLDKEGNFSDSLLNKRALQNARFTDLENANIAAVKAESVLRDDWNPLLYNNYIYLEKQVEDYTDYIIFKVDITDDVIDQVRGCWKQNDMASYNDIQVGLVYLYTGAEKTENHVKFQRKLSENVAPFAIRGQLTGRNPATARIGTNDGVKIGDMVTLYRQAVDKNGNMVSNRISRARVNSVDDTDCQMFFIGGTKGSYKDGDMVVLTPDKKMGVGIYANYSLGRFFGVSATWDWILHVTKAGFSGRMLVQAKGDFGNYSKELKEFLKEGVKSEGHSVNPPFFLNVGAGYGLAWTLLGRFEIMPYAMAQFEYARFQGKENYTSWQAYGLRIPAGVRFDINIAYPLKLSFGAEYAYVIPLSRNKDARYEPNSKAITLGYKSFVKDLFKADNNHTKRDAINFYVGLRWVF